MTGDLTAVNCAACKFENEFGSRECPHPVDARAHTCAAGQAQADEENARRRQNRERAKTMSFNDPTMGHGLTPEGYRQVALHRLADNLKVPYEDFRKELDRYVEGFPLTQVDAWLLTMELEDLRLFREVIRRMVSERGTQSRVHMGLSMERFSEVSGLPLDEVRRIRDKLLESWPALREYVELADMERSTVLTNAARIVRSVVGEHGMVVFNKPYSMVHVANLSSEPESPQAVTAKTLAEAIAAFQQKYPREKKDG